MFKTDAPPEKEILIFPPNSEASLQARLIVIGNKALPDIYLSSPPSTSVIFLLARVLESFIPNLLPCSSAKSFIFLIRFTASLYLRSCSNVLSSILI
ncbi:hypothetical protein ES703_120110 [subsurface metagenome]